MALIRHLKVYSLKSFPGALLENRNNKDFLWAEEKCAVILNNADGNKLKATSTKIADAYGCLGAVNLTKGAERNGYFLVLVTGCKNVGRILDSDIYRIADVSFVSIKDGSVDNSTAASEMKRLLCTGSFYFVSSNSDESKKTLLITLSLQKLSSEPQEREQFLWNRSFLAYFSMQGIPCKPWFLYVMCGGVDIRTIYVGAHQARACVINRLNCERVGTRYNVRGVDDAGNVANFVESEQILCIGDKFSSFVMTRGSVPLYWEQPGLNVGSHKVKIPFGFDVSFRAFERHFDKIREQYGDCALINLLGSKEGEAYLSRTYKFNHEKSQYSSQMPLICFDYHSECRAGKASNITKLMDQLNPLLSRFGFYSVVDGITREQTGVLRVNCLDCLDRTNSVQSYVGLEMIAKQLEVLGYTDNSQLLARFTEALKGTWQLTGDLISRMYAGTGALEGKNTVGKLKDGARSISRSIQNNFLDQGKQETMDTLLRIPFHDPELHHLSRTILNQNQFRYSSTVLLKNVCERKSDFSEEFLLRICVGTWNVNGGKFFRSIAHKDKTLKDWLIVDDDSKSSKAYYQAMYEYNSNEEGDLRLSVNDFVIVDYELEDGAWLHGIKGHEEGIFPSAYVQQLSNPHVVIHDFSAQQDGDLDLFTDDIVDVMNMNGEWLDGKVMRDGLIEEGVFPANFVEKIGSDSDESTPGDIYAIGFEEMVELNTGNILNASQENQQAWSLELQKTISGKREYVLITSEQLVGVCLFLFVRKDMLDDVREVSVSTIKTGMGGATGNKGAVAISCKIYDSSVCFVCSHFAAGQTQIQERNNDFAEISSKLSFVKGRTLFYHDYVFWCGDFNYRIDLTGDEVKQLVKSESWEKLRENDQLLVQKTMGNTFKGFQEGVINFAPTYKYDLFSDDYDTSEKCRVPAWTDRVLWKRRKWFSEQAQSDEVEGSDSGTLILYNRAELKTSDHRPVIAMIDVLMSRVIEAERSRVYDELSKQLEPINSSVYVYVEGKSPDEELCKKFLASLGLTADFIVRRLFTACMVICPEAWMAGNILDHDGAFFESKRMRISVTDDNTVEEVAVVTGQAQTSESLSLPELDQNAGVVESKSSQPTPLPSALPTSHSSDNVASLRVSTMARPRSTPQLSDLVKQREPPVAASQPSKKPPPRPPAISNPPPQRPPPIASSLLKSVGPGSGQSSPRSRSPTATLLQQTSVEANTTSSVDIPFPDLSTWNPTSEPPKIKPRKTVPKRRAPVPPSKPPLPQKTTKAPPVPPNPSQQRPLTGSLLDDAFSCDSISSMPPPLIPLHSSSSVGSASSQGVLAPPLPDQTSNGPSVIKPARPPPVAPRQPTSASSLPPPLLPTVPLNENNTSNQKKDGTQDPWSIGAANNHSSVTKTFTTNFNDFSFT